jgi:TM2 domain-containing membrane protein YozV
MRKLLAIFFLIPFVAYSQSTSFDFHSAKNIKKFADYLFCQGDYLRAVEEYESIKTIINNDTIDFKIMLCYSEIGLYQMSNLSEVILSNSVYRREADQLSLKNQFKESSNSFYQLSESEVFTFTSADSTTINYFQKLASVSYLLGTAESLSKDKILNPFDNSEKITVSSFYDWKINPPYKSAFLAGILSAVIPGSGKMYVGEWGDGITALLATGLLTFLVYDNFRADHETRAWIFTGLGAFFYAGNIYGSIGSTQIFNARINFEFNEGIKLFLEQKNYFLPEYGFCK